MTFQLGLVLSLGLCLTAGTLSSGAIISRNSSQNQTFENTSDTDAPVCSCGDRNEEDRIVGGHDAKLGEFPWRCALFLKESSGMTLFCGCSVISDQYILTAAHCTHAVKDRQIYVDVGDYDITKKTEVENQVIKVAQVIQHEDYNGANHDNDVSLLKLERTVTYSRTISPICLPWKFKGATFQNSTVVASGSGTLQEGGQASPILQTVDLPLLTTEECQQYYGARLITSNMVCTYEPGKDTCQGDSGSSIDFKDNETGQYYAVGVVSWGMGCGRKNKPGVYTKLGNYLDWIEAKAIGAQFCKS